MMLSDEDQHVFGRECQMVKYETLSFVVHTVAVPTTPTFTDENKQNKGGYVPIKLYL